MTSDITLIDLKNPKDKIWIEPFLKYISQLQAQKGQDTLINNYLNLDKLWREYDTFNLLVQSEKILGFSGAHTHPYPQDTSRVLSRLYYDPEIRSKHLAGHKLPSFAASIMLPYQIEKARGQNKRTVFLSFQGLKRRAFCFQLAKVLQETYSQDWQVEQAMVNTARLLPSGALNMSRDVWQNAVVLRLDATATLNLPKMTIDQWEKNFLAHEK